MVSRAVLLVLVVLATPVSAQVIRDGSIGPGGLGPVAGGVDDLGQPATYLIHEGLGERAGPNLFHSFDQFSVGSGETATFTATLPTDNVLGRVTGGSEEEGEAEAPSSVIQPVGRLRGRDRPQETSPASASKTGEIR